MLMYIIENLRDVFFWGNFTQLYRDTLGVALLALYLKASFITILAQSIYILFVSDV